MHFLETFNKKIIKHDLINKFNYTNTEKLPELKKLTTNFGCRNFKPHKLATTLLALEIITSKKGAFTVAKNPNVLLKIQKGQPVGCKVTLKKKEIFFFLNKILIETLPKVKNFSGFKMQTQSSAISFKLLNDKIKLQEFENLYPLFTDLPNLDITIITNTTNYKELLFLIKSTKIPIYKEKP